MFGVSSASLLISNRQFLSLFRDVSELLTEAGKILKLMNRRYSVSEFINKIQLIRNLRDDISITTDLIVGFPGETDADFQNTIQSLKEIKFTKIHTFPYSKRDGTVASEMKDQVDSVVKKRRVKEILKLSSYFEKEYYSHFVDKIMDGVTELKKDNTILVHTTNFIPVIVNNCNVSNNTVVKVRITCVDDDGCVYGKIILSE